MNESFSTVISVLRKERGWSQEKLAEKCGVSRQAVAKWESGKCYPDIMRMLDLADLLEVSINDLVPDTNNYRERYSVIIDTLVSDCYAFCYSNVDTGEIIYSFSGRNISEGILSDSKFGHIGNCYSKELHEMHKSILHPEDYEKFAQLVSQDFVKSILEENNSFSYRYRIISKENKIVYAQTTYRRAQNYESNHNFVTIIRDISEDMGELMQKQNIIGMISKHYESMYYVDCDLDLFKRITSADVLKNDTSIDTSWFTTLDFGVSYVNKYADNFVLDEYKEEFLRIVNPEYLAAYLGKHDSISYIYQAYNEGSVSYYRVAANRENESSRRFIVWVENIDVIVKSVK